MLADDKPERDIIALDSEHDELHIRLEKLDAQVRFIEAEIVRATEAQTLERWLAVNENRLSAARKYADALAKAQDAYRNFCEARQPTLAPEFKSIYVPFGSV